MDRIRRRRGLVAAVCVLSSMGCALPMPFECEDGPCEFIAGYARRDPEGARFRRVVPGVDVRRGWLTQGVTLGWSDLRLLRSSEASDRLDRSEGPARGLGLPFFLRWRGESSSENRLGLFLLGAPRLERAFVHHIRIGASAMGGAHDSGLEAGFSSVTHLAVPIDEEDSGVYRLRYRSRDFGSSTYQRHEVPNDEVN